MRVSALACSVTAGCSVGEAPASETSAASTTTAAACAATPTTAEGPMKNASGQPIDGSSKTTLSGCIAGHSGEAAGDLVTRAENAVSDATFFDRIEDTPGHKLLSAFTPVGPATGTLTTGLVQDVDVTLNQQYSPTARLRFTRKVTAPGLITVTITNTTALEAHPLFSVTVVNPGDLVITLSLTPQAAGGLATTGSAQVLMQQGQDHAHEVSGLVIPVFNELAKELNL